MDDLRIASSDADARAAAAVEEHHAQLAGVLALKTETLAAAARAGRQADADADEVRADLVRWCRDELVPHALAEEEALYPAAAAMPGARLLVEAMLAEHRLLLGLVDRLAAAAHPVDAAALALALRTVFGSHLDKENEQILPLLVAAPAVSVAGLLAGMHELLGGEAHEAAPACSCDEVDGSRHPELDARAVPHAIRHATVFGALDGLHPGGGLILVAPHDPLPLLAQLERRSPGLFVIDYLQSGPDAWRLEIVRRSA